MFRGASELEKKRFRIVHDALKQNRYPSKSALAQRFDSSEKTVQRTLGLMRDLYAVQIDYCSTRGGYFYAKKPSDIEKELEGVDIDERDWINLALAVKTLEFVGLKHGAKNIREWIKSISGKSLAQHANKVECILSLADLRPAHILPSDLQDLLTALVRRQWVSFKYRKLNDRKAALRTVFPYHLTYRDSTWYLIAYDPDRKDRRTYSLARLGTVCILNRPTDHVPPFDPQQHFADGQVIQNGKRHTVHLVFDSEEAGRVRERSYAFDHVDKDRPYKTDSQGRLHLRFRHPLLEALVPIVLSFGKSVEIRSPKALQKLVRDHYHGALARLP
jgi:predicted DNA-binding transcriptional regulator YafY